MKKSKPITIEEAHKVIDSIRLLKGNVTVRNINPTQAILTEEDIDLLIEAVQVVEMDTSKVTRVEVIDNEGRKYANWKDDNKVEVQFQDKKRTLKIFINC